jgi:hypothetical protein
VPLLLAGIMAGGLLLRLVFFIASLPSGGAPFIRDETNYVGLAVPLSQGQGFVDKWVWLRPPGYPMFVAAFTALGGGNLSIAGMAQIVLSVLNIGLVYLLAVEVFGNRADVPPGKAKAAGLMAAGLMAINPHVVFYANLLMVETLYMFALTVVAWALLRALRAWNRQAEAQEPAATAFRIPRSAYSLVALAGLAAGAAVLVRSLLLTFVPLLLIWFWWNARSPTSGSAPTQNPDAQSATKTQNRGALWAAKIQGRRLLLPVLFLVVMFAVILPWTVRNYVRYNRFLLVETTGGYNLWIYNDINTSPAEINRRLMEISNPVDRERYAAQQGIRAITSNLPEFAAVAAGRFVSAWPVDRFYEFRVFLRDKYPGTDCTNLDIFAWLGTLFYTGLALLTIWGLVLAPGRTFKALVLLVLLHYGLATMFSNQEFRFRMPLYPFLSVYAGWVLVGVMRKGLREEHPPTLTHYALRITHYAFPFALSLAFLVQCLFLALPGFTDAVRYERRYLDGKSALGRGDYSAALADFMGASEVDKSCACLYRDIGLAYAGLRELDKERAAYTTAISTEEHDWRTRALLSDRLRAAGDPHAANPLALTRPEFRAQQQRWAWEYLSPPQTPVVDVGAVDIGYVMDFQSPETEPLAGGGNISYRWTTSHSYARMPIPPGDGTLRMVMHWHSLAWPGKPDPNATVRVLLNGVQAGTLTAHPGWEDASLDLPSMVGSPIAVIELLAPTATPPGAESRLLGVAVDSIGLVRR